MPAGRDSHRVGPPCGSVAKSGRQHGAGGHPGFFNHFEPTVDEICSVWHSATKFSGAEPTAEVES